MGIGSKEERALERVRELLRFYSSGEGNPQSNELTRGPPELVITFVYRGVHIGATCPNLLWFGYILRLSHWGGGGVISSFILFLRAFAKRRGRVEGVGTL